VCGEYVIKGYKLATLPISRIDKKNYKMTLKNTLNLNLKKPPTPTKACLQHQSHCNCGLTVRHFWYHVHGSVQLHHFLWPVNVCGVFSSVPIWTVSSWHQTYRSSSLSSYRVLQGYIDSSKLANTRYWKGLCSKGFQHFDMQTVAVGNELHTEYSVVFIKYSFT
jgi:hypothetical protein